MLYLRDCVLHLDSWSLISKNETKCLSWVANQHMAYTESQSDAVVHFILVINPSFTFSDLTQVFKFSKNRWKIAPPPQCINKWLVVEVAGWDEWFPRQELVWYAVYTKYYVFHICSRLQSFSIARPWSLYFFMITYVVDSIE